MIRTGIGYDSHRLVEGRELILGGIVIPFDRGLEGHSDADVLCHSIIDSVLGALGEGDIGMHFPDTEARWKDASSIDLLKKVIEMARERGYEVSWVDASIIAEAPKLGPHLEAMKKEIAGSGVKQDRINLKATTNEGMGFTGRGEGIAVIAVSTLTGTGS
ncbi:MAG: 2-C-methyl-D-erythritol 2,4-cyclodiphosphate synthase [Nitrospirota bacterium]|nr:MAG: 2-C-methyl-D-erythritol 2,4-cyclodiphosphate synthase [Nitrospirota bacterium]